MSDKAEDVISVLAHAQLKLPAGAFRDQQTLYRAAEHGLIRFEYEVREYPFLGWSVSYTTWHAYLTEAGAAALSSMTRPARSLTHP